MVDVSFFLERTYIGDISMEDDDSLKFGSAMYKLLYKVVERCL